MSRIKGKSGLFKIGDTNIANIKTIMIDETAETEDVSTLGGADVRDFEVTITSWSGSAEVFYDPADTGGQATLAIGSSASIKFYPSGEEDGEIFRSGDVLITGRSMSNAVGSFVGLSLKFQGTGVLASTTV